MKKIIFIFIISTLNILAGEGNGGGGPRMGTVLLMSTRDEINIDQVDNVEINDQINIPQSLKEKIKLLKRDNVQSIQLIDGTIISNK